MTFTMWLLDNAAKYNYQISEAQRCIVLAVVAAGVVCMIGSIMFFAHSAPITGIVCFFTGIIVALFGIPLTELLACWNMRSSASIKP